jgi:hypothetical protein
VIQDSNQLQDIICDVEALCSCSLKYISCHFHNKFSWYFVLQRCRTAGYQYKTGRILCCTRNKGTHATCVLYPLQRRRSPREGIRGSSAVGLEGDFAIYM